MQKNVLIMEIAIMLVSNKAVFGFGLKGVELSLVNLNFF
jgi:hypothetical protein